MFEPQKERWLDPQTAQIPSSDDSVSGGIGEAMPGVLPILPVRGLVLFPGTVMPLLLGRKSSLRILEAAQPAPGIVGVFSQRDPTQEEPEPGGLFSVGCAARVLKVVHQTQGNAFVVVEGICRVRYRETKSLVPYLQAAMDVLKEVAPPEAESHWAAEVRNLRESALKLLELLPDVPEEASNALVGIESGGALADFLSANLTLELGQKQALLEETDIGARVRSLQSHITMQLEIAQIQQKLRHEVQSQFTEAQRRAYLQEQILAIRRELNDGGGSPEGQVEELRERLKKAGPGEEVMEIAERELKRLEFIPAASPEYALVVGYLEALAGLPWNQLTADHLDLKAAQTILDRDHFDLARIKRRLLEYLAVRKLNPEGRGPILCFIGPPGVGKTSLGQSIADALGRKFARISLGGIRDEAEIRGHRRTYIGAMPGRIMQELRRVMSRNPVLMLDEVDKLGTDFRGDPASALLEVLDPWQNHAFVDRYLDVPFDLSKVIFIATANSLDPIPDALRDRLEVVELPGYTAREKFEIGRRYLVPRQLKENGLTQEDCRWEDAALEQVVSEYTHEAGVRELERQIAGVCRAVAAKVAAGNDAKAPGKRAQEIITVRLMREILGPARYVQEQKLASNLPGVATGLAYTPMGGEILHIEATRYPGKGDITLTGQLGEVMRESVEAALSLLRSRAAGLGIQAQSFRENDIHVHVPSGAVPKDGPSAGIAMYTALASLFMNVPVRANVAMTGEISLRGLVLPVGGLKEKSLAAMRAGIDTVLVPALNEKDLVEVPEEAREKLHFVLVDTVDEALEKALARAIPQSDVKRQAWAARGWG